MGKKKTVRSLDAKHPVEMNPVNGTCYKIFKIRKKREPSPVYATTTCRGSRGTAPLHLKFGTIE